METLWLVIPCYNEEDVLPETSQRLLKIISNMISEKAISPDSRIAFVNDGSRDKTWELIEQYHNENDIFTGISLSKNRGHQNALLAGLTVAVKHADIIITLDADLQDDISKIPEMVEKHNDGNEIVFGVRNDRKSDTGFKRNTAGGFYKFMRLLGVEIISNHADYRLMSKRAVEALLEYKETNLFLRGIIPQLGFKTDTVEYSRQERTKGKSKYSLNKMLSLAFEGITSFSVKPLKISLFMGAAAFLVAIGILIYSVVQFFMGNTVSGWTSLSVSVWALGGMQLLMLGIVGEYIGKIYLEAKHRPRFIIDKILHKKDTR